jgi:uncharacterized protein YndB with AHSA1/START domain
VFSTAEGFKKMGVAQCELELRPGGLIRTHYDPKGVLGDEGTIVNEVMAFEPPRMIAFRVHRPPASFPFKEAWKGTWSVATLTDQGDGTTHVRLAGMGYTDEPESRAMREFFEKGNAWTMQTLRSALEGTPPPAGGAHELDPLGSITHEAAVSLPRGEVWRLLTTGEGWREFFGVSARVEPTPGGAFEILFTDAAPEGQRGSEGCNVLSVDPGRMLSFDWSAPPTFAHARARRTWVVVTLDELAPARTRVTLRHHGFAEQARANPEHREEWTKVRAYFQNAWGKVLGELAAKGK